MSFVRFGLDRRPARPLSSATSGLKANPLASLFLLALLAFALAALLTGSVPALAQSDVDYDADDDGLIEISNLAQLDAIRHDLDGGGWTGGDFPQYTGAFPNTVEGMGCPDTGCRGYELTADLDFDTNGDGATGEGDAYWNGGAGWDPLGKGPRKGTCNRCRGAYHGEFHGNGHTISNLYINRRSWDDLGLFGAIASSAYVHHVGLLNVNITGNDSQGGLVGYIMKNTAAVASSYATGVISGGRWSGGLVGYSNGFVVASWTNASVTGGTDAVGGVVGHNNGAVWSLYALGTVRGSGETHGVVGWTKNQDNLRSAGIYYNSDRHAKAHFPYSRTLLELAGPTGYTGIYAKWNVDRYRVGSGDDPWDFGASNELPALKADRNGDGVATWREFGIQMRGGKDYDRDDDGLIYVSSLEKLNAIRFDLDGNGFPESGHAQYAAAFPGAAFNMGCPAACKGYELTEDLDFDANRTGRVGANDPYWNNGLGWRPIGYDGDGAYTGEFHGNGHTISYLFVNRDGSQVGLFGLISGSAFVHHVGLLEAKVTTTGKDVGALVGFVKGNKARVSANYATGDVTGGKHSGGLVGSNQGYVRANWAEVRVRGTRHVGGLVGHNGGEVSASYSLGVVNGDSRVHGVVGWTEGGSLKDVYFRADINPDVVDRHAKSKADLREPTGYTGIYQNWNVDLDGKDGPDDPWDFWTDIRYPRLKADRDGDGRPTRQEFEGQNPGRGIRDLVDHDKDNDGLIEVSTLRQLNAIRLDLDGNGVPESEKPSYDQTFPDARPGLGCPDTGCVGYELVANLHLDTNSNGQADAEDYLWNAGAGWRPIGSAGGPYTAQFHGNGYTISDLYVNHNGNHAGLFGLISGSAFIHHVGLPNVNVTASGKDVGALVGFIRGNRAAVAAAFATGTVSGGNQTGGLVGSSQGYVVSAWTNVTVSGARHVGGVVGHNRGSVQGVYALGSVTGNARSNGVVGWTDGGHLGPAYYNSDNHSPEGADELAKTTAELQEPTGYTGIYAQWGLDSDRTDNAGFTRQGDPWDFGGSSDYPKLRAFQQPGGL